MDNLKSDPNIKPIKDASERQEIQEISISLGIKNLTPALVSPDFMIASGLFAANWEMLHKPIVAPNGTQINYKNGIGFLAKSDTIIFIENVSNKTQKEIQIVKITANYLAKLPQLQYQGINLSFKTIIPLISQFNTSTEYFNQVILADGSWKNIGQGIKQATVSLLYELPLGQLNININEARLRKPDQTIIPALLFHGTFNYRFTAEETKIVQKLITILKNWQKNLEQFNNIVYQDFLSQQSYIPEVTSVFPNSW